MYKDLLPLGSIVLLKGGNKRIMVCGRIQVRDGEDEIYDYSACYFPEGITGSSDMFFFNRNAIERIYFLGCQDNEELEFNSKVLGSLGELIVVDGQIVPKE